MKIIPHRTKALKICCRMPSSVTRRHDTGLLEEGWWVVARPRWAAARPARRSMSVATVRTPAPQPSSNRSPLWWPRAGGFAQRWSRSRPASPPPPGSGPRSAGGRKCRPRPSGRSTPGRSARTEPFGQVPPGQAGAELEHDALKDLAVVPPAVTGPADGRQQRRDHRPRSGRNLPVPHHRTDGPMIGKTPPGACPVDP